MHYYVSGIKYSDVNKKQFIDNNKRTCSCIMMKVIMMKISIIHTRTRTVTVN